MAASLDGSIPVSSASRRQAASLTTRAQALRVRGRAVPGVPPSFLATCSMLAPTSRPETLRSGVAVRPHVPQRRERRVTLPRQFPVHATLPRSCSQARDQPVARLSNERSDPSSPAQPDASDPATRHAICRDTDIQNLHHPSCRAPYRSDLRNPGRSRRARRQLSDRHSLWRSYRLGEERPCQRNGDCRGPWANVWS